MTDDFLHTITTGSLLNSLRRVAPPGAQRAPPMLLDRIAKDYVRPLLHKPLYKRTEFLRAAFTVTKRQADSKSLLERWGVESNVRRLCLNSVEVVLKKYETDQAYQLWTGQKALDVAARFAENNRIEAACFDWRYMAYHRRTSVVEEAVDTHHRVFGLASSPNCVFSHRPESAMAGEYNHRGIIFNTASVQYWEKSFYEALNTGGHEYTHFFQEQIGMLHEDGMLKPGGALARQARLFAGLKMRDGEDIYFMPDDHYRIYINHPLERDAVCIASTIGDHFRRAIQSLGSPHSMPPMRRDYNQCYKPEEQLRTLARR